MRHLNPQTAALLTSGLLLTSAACGGNDPNAGSGPTPSNPTSSSTDAADPSPTEPTTSEPATEEDKAAAALLGYLEVRDKAYATGRISKELNTYATGREHFALQQFVTSLNQNPRTHFEGDWVHEVMKIRQLSAEVILVTDCQDASDVSLIRDGDNEVLPWFTNDAGKAIPRRLQQTYRVIPDGETWKVESGASNPNRPQTC
ncbi:hypothetical protein GCM10023339_41110 [Alloalcanivorax gelatiniphagus]